MPYAAGKKAYFVLGTPEFMVSKFNGASAQSREFRDFLSGLAMHELAHTRQMPQLMPVLDRLQKRYRFPESINDKLIESTFSRDADFKAMYDRAAGHLQAAVMAPKTTPSPGNTPVRLCASYALGKSDSSPGNETVGLRSEEVFLTLEGVGQWVLYKHALSTRRLDKPGSRRWSKWPARRTRGRKAWGSGCSC